MPALVEPGLQWETKYSSSTHQCKVLTQIKPLPGAVLGPVRGTERRCEGGRSQGADGCARARPAPGELRKRVGPKPEEVVCEGACQKAVALAPSCCMKSP